MTLEEQKRLARKVIAVKDRDTGCILFLGRRNDAGYGLISHKVNGKYKALRAHRVSYEINIGPIPAGMMVCHRCDNPPCINPAHLFVGTSKDNMADCKLKNRLRPRKGAAHPKAKLTPDMVRNAIRLHRSGMPIIELAKKYGVSKSAMGDAINGGSWKDVDEKRSPVRKPTIKSKRPVMGTHAVTGEVIKFDSATEAAKHGFSRQNIKLCIKNGWKHRSYYWKYEPAAIQALLQEGK